MPARYLSAFRSSLTLGALLSILLLLPSFSHAQTSGLEYRIGPEDMLHPTDFSGSKILI